MSKPVRFRIREHVAIVTLDQPSGNVLDAAVRAGLWEIFDRIATHESVQAVMLQGEGETFSVGMDIRDDGAGGDGPSLAQVCDKIESCPHPVIAGLQGTVLGGGAELALACHLRLAGPDMRIGFPDVSLGLVPGAGATQRLPRLVGAEAALSLLVTGRPVAAESARKLGLVSGVVVGHLPTGVHAFARKRIEAGDRPTPVRRLRDRLTDGDAYVDAVARFRGELGQSRILAQRRIVDCVEAALLLPFEAGLAFEAAAREECLAGPQPAALRHVYLAERRIASRLLTTTEGKRTIAEPAGADVVARLQHVMGQAANALTGQGIDAAEIDRALVDHGFARTPFGGKEGGAGPQGALIARRMVAALMAEGCRLVEARKVDRAADIDVLAVYGLGYPRLQGGPMRAAQTLGLLRLKREMAEWAKDSALWTPPALLGEAVKYAGGFDEATLRDAA